MIIAVECKYYSRNIDVKIVDSFIGFLEDIGAHNMGIIITNMGYSPAAENRAKAKLIKLEIMTFEEFEEYDIFEALAEDFYLEEAGLEGTPNEEEVIEEIDENEDIQEIFETARKYKSSLSGYAEEIMEIFSQVMHKCFALEQARFKEIFRDVIFDIFSTFDHENLSFYELRLRTIEQNEIERYLYSVESDLMAFLNNVNNIVDECYVSDAFNLMSLNNLTGEVLLLIYRMGQ